MSEKNPKGLSVSFRVDSGFLDHNNRVITAHNVDIYLCDTGDPYRRPCRPI